jgi:PE family
MSFLVTSPDVLSSAAKDLANIGSTITEARTVALPATTSLLPAAADEVSEAIASLFAGHGQSFQALSATVSQFHEQFVQSLSRGAASYLGAEAANASPLQQLQQGELGLGSGLAGRELAFNHTLLGGEVALEQQIFGTDSALNGGVNRVFNAFNLLFGTGEQTANSLVGVQAPVGLTAGLLTGTGAQVFNGGQIGGLEGVFDQGLAGFADFTGLLGSNPLGVSSPAGFLAQLQQSQLSFNANMVNHQLNLDHILLTGELRWEQGTFGTDSALNGVVNRGFNAVNLLVGTGQQTVDSLLGAQVPTNFASGLLTGSGNQVFNGGQIGGLVGAFDQSLAGTADFAGLLAGGGSPAAAAHSLAAAPVDPVGAFLGNVAAGQLHFNTNLVGHELGFNSWVINHELAFENSYLGAGAFNGGENRVFNTENLFIGTGEELLNSVVGATNWSPAGLTASLLTGSSAQVFNGGAIAGLEGIIDQGLAANADLAGLI